MKRKIYFVFIALGFMLCGCALVNESLRNTYENNKAVQKGAQFVNNKGLYGFTVTEDDYYMEENARGVVLMPRDIYAFSRGNYLIQTYPIRILPQDIIRDLRTSFNWINENIIFKHSRQKVDILFTEDRTYQEEKVLYLECFIPGKTKKGFWGAKVVENDSYGYASIVFYHREHLYWIYYSDPYDILDYKPSEKPEVKEQTKQRFEEFLSKMSIDPKPKNKLDSLKIGSPT